MARPFSLSRLRGRDFCCPPPGGSVCRALLLSLLITPAAFCADEVFDLDEIVVTATRTRTPSREIASTTTIITGKDIEKRQKDTALELLREVAGIDVVQSGGMGRTSSIYIRGAEPGHTLVLMDGVEMNDPGSSRRLCDLSTFTTENIERIEIIRGPQSTLYGSDAIGGVINIITKKGSGKPSFSVSAEGGSLNTFKESFSSSGGSSVVNYSVGVTRIDTDGISAAGKKYGNGEKDGFENTSFSARFGYTPTENFELDLIVKHSDSIADLDNGAGAGKDDPNHVFESKRFSFRTEANITLPDKKWDQKIGFSFASQERKDINEKDIDHPDDLRRSSFDGRLIEFDWQHNFHLHETNTLTLGLEIEEEAMESDDYREQASGISMSAFKKKTAQTQGYYLQDQIRLADAFFATLGVRIDEHDEFGSKTTYRLAPAYLFKQTGTKIKATYGTGFKAPSLSQLFHPDWGNADLKSEESIGWDIGVEQFFWNKKANFSVTYFSNEFDNMIDWVSSGGVSGYQNITEAESKGIELLLSVRPIESITFHTHYTRTNTENKTTEKDLRRRPEDKFGFDMDWRFHEKGNVRLGVIYVGERYSDSASQKNLDDYTLVNLAASYDINKNFQWLGCVENLFDEDYEENTGYGTPGTSVHTGFKMMF